VVFSNIQVVIFSEKKKGRRNHSRVSERKSEEEGGKKEQLYNDVKGKGRERGAADERDD